jgi:hypothetical protein
MQLSNKVPNLKEDSLMPNEKTMAFNEFSKRQYEMDETFAKYAEARGKYRETIVNENVQYILSVLKEEGTVTESHLKLLLGNLAMDIANLYSK